MRVPGGTPASLGISYLCLWYRRATGWLSSAEVGTVSQCGVIGRQPLASRLSEQGTGGWAWILSDMKSLLETGSSM